jgi:hypothetical protein
MPTYPDYRHHDDSRIERVQKVEAEQATNGRFRSRVMGPVKHRFTVVHILSRADSDALDSFHAAHASDDLDFVWRTTGTAHTVAFMGPPQIEKETVRMYRVTVQLAEV